MILETPVWPYVYTRSFKYGTGEASLAGLEDDGSERPGVRTWVVPGL